MDQEYIGTITVKTTVQHKKAPNGINYIIILDYSSSMGDSVCRITNEILPIFFTKLFYEKSQIIHLITFDSRTAHFEVKVANFNNLSIQAGGNTFMSPAVSMFKEILQDFEVSKTEKPIRLLTISGGEVDDPYEVKKVAQSFKDFATSNFKINSQAVRFF